MHVASSIGAVLLMLSLAGCAGYKLGPSNGMAAGSRSVQINLFENKTLEPRLSEAVGIALRRAMQQDGTYRLDTAGTGDVVVNGVLTKYERLSLSFQPRDIISTRDFEIRLHAHIVAVDRSTGKTVLDRDVVGRTTLRYKEDLSSMERQTLPVLADDLARNITSLLADGTF